NAIGSIADVFRDTGRLAECIALNLRYVDLKSDIGARGGICTGQLSLAELNWSVGRSELAREYAARARALANELGQPWERRALFVQGMVRDDEALLKEAVAGADDTSLYVLPALLELARCGDGEALARAAAVDSPLAKVLVPALRGQADAARAALDEHGMAAGVLVCMEARFRIGDIERAHELLIHLRDHAPEDCRDSMIDNVPLHRDIMMAWEERGEKGA
ncbi:MAG: hypothetical protein ACYTGV_17370, partial [Planctomycetota bacterium]